jgi:hypothetical protein
MPEVTPLFNPALAPVAGLACKFLPVNHRSARPASRSPLRALAAAGLPAVLAG